MSYSCGACNLCCKVLHVPDIGKPANMTCWWTTIHGGCLRQADKATAPELQACAQWKCLWLESQAHENEAFRQPYHLRPDKTHVVLGPQDRDDETLLYVHVDPAHADAWREPGVAAILNDIISRGGRLCIYVGENHFEVSELI